MVWRVKVRGVAGDIVGGKWCEGCGVGLESTVLICGAVK